jgi:hypothetical protein
MKEKNKIFKLNNSKKELLNKALNTKTFKIIKYSVIAIGGIFIAGKVFKIIAIANTNFKLLKNSLK